MTNTGIIWENYTLVSLVVFNLALLNISESYPQLYMHGVFEMVVHVHWYVVSYLPLSFSKENVFLHEAAQEITGDGVPVLKARVNSKCGSSIPMIPEKLFSLILYQLAKWDIYVSLRLRVQNAVSAQPCVGKFRISLVLLNFLHCNFRLWFETP